MHLEPTSALIITVAYAVIFAAGEVLYNRTSIGAEGSRKVTHVAGGLLGLTLPHLFESWQTVLILGGLFAITLIFTKRRKLIGSVHAVERQTWGEIWFPIALGGLFTLCVLTDTLPYFAPALMTLALGDMTAWYVGSRFGKTRLPVGDRAKTLEGSIALFTLSFLMSMILLSATLDRLASVELIGAAFAGAIVATIAEGLSRHGFDNLTVPIGVWATLAAILGAPPV